MWLAKLKRMMDELPDKYLEPWPLDPQDKALLPSDSKLVSQITEEEKQLYGVFRQLSDSLRSEDDVHQILHKQGIWHSPDSCQRFNERMSLREEEIVLIKGILLMTLGERLGFENYYIIDGYNVYSVTEVMVMEQTDIPKFTGEWPKSES